MTSELVKVERIKRRAQKDQMLYDGLFRAMDITVNFLQIDGLALLTTWTITEWLQNTRAPWADPAKASTDPSTHFIGPIAAGAIQTALLAGFALNGFGESGIPGLIKK